MGNANVEIASDLERLAKLYERRDNFDAAKKARSEVADIETHILGRDHWQVIDAREAIRDTELRAALSAEQRKQLHQATEFLGEVSRLNAEGKYSQAIQIAEQAAAIRRVVLGPEHFDYAVAVGWLGTVHDNAGDYSRAEPLYLQALTIKNKVVGEEHPSYAQTLNNLADLCTSRGEFECAESLYLQAMQVRKKAHGEFHPAYATSLRGLATLYKLLGEYGRAEPLFRQASAIWKNTPDEVRSDYIQNLNNLANLYQAQGDNVAGRTSLPSSPDL